MPFRPPRAALAFLAAALFGPPLPGAAQEPPAENGTRPRVFFDCNGPNCNSDYFRTEIGWVNWVRDRADAQVHVLVVSEGTGSGGRAYQMTFMGRGAQADYSDGMTYTSQSVDTQRETLDGMAHTLALGLARFASASGYRSLVRVQGTSTNGQLQRAGLVSAEEVDDPWNLWSFRFGGGGDLSGESTQESLRLNGSFNASRVTPTWKLNYSGRINHQHQEFERSDGSTLVVDRTDWNGDALMVYSLADQWSMGVRAGTGRMTRFNQDFRLSVTPAVEYSFFPYSEATRRALTAYYEIGPTYRNYIAETVYGEMEETNWEHSLQIRYSQREPWGDASVGIEGSHFLHDVSLRNVALRGGLSFRVTRGLSVDTNANISWVNDQIYLASQGETDEEILLRLRQRSTSFSYGVSLGFSYQFGSIFNNVVNNRFRRPWGGGGGGGGFG